jgi:large subunit ribosomal protein L30e
MVDIGRALRAAIETGDVRLGSRQTRKSLASTEAKMVILARNFPGELPPFEGRVKVHQFEGSNLELGAACGKPFSISAVAIVDPGKSNILSL